MESTSCQEVPVVSFIGWSGSGKTTFLEQVVRCLSLEGLRVGVLKHHGHITTVDVKGKDTWRYEQAGANPVVVSSAAEYSIIRKVDKEKSLSELAALIADESDIIVTEGFRQQARYIVEFRRKEHNNQQIYSLDQIIALVCDDEEARTAARAADIPTFTPDDAAAMALFLKDWRP